MEIIKDLVQSIRNDSSISRILAGVHWTAVTSHNCGMASTVMSSKPHGEDTVRDAGNLEGKSARELANYLLSDNPLEASIGLASFNSLIELPKEGLIKINAFQYLVEKGKQKHVAIFGHFPYIADVRMTANKLDVYELSPEEGEHPLSEIPDLLPDAEIVAITSNSIINHTLDAILPYIKKGAFVGMVGPSTPLSPVLFEYGISMLSGVRVTDQDALYRSISQAAIFRQVEGVDLVTWLKYSAPD